MDKYVLFPIKDDAVWAMYKQHVACFWTVEEVDLAQDVKDWKELAEGERAFIKHILAFFAASDGIVFENVVTRFAAESPSAEASCFYGFQGAMENIHAEMYSQLIDTFISDPEEKVQLFNAVGEYPSIRAKAEWALDYMHATSPQPERILAFAVVEGIFFSASFCAIFWLKFKRAGKMPGLTTSNEFISRDEGLHCDFACLLYKRFAPPGTPNAPCRLSDERAHEIVGRAVKLESDFATASLPERLMGMNSVLMCRYVEFVADRLLVALGHPKLFETQNPFGFMEAISLQGKTNFFEKRVTDYQKPLASREFSLDADF